MTSSRTSTATNEYKTESLIAKKISSYNLPCDTSTLQSYSLPELASSVIDAVHILPDGRVLVAHMREPDDHYKLTVLTDIQSKSIIQEIDLLARGNYLLPLSHDKLLYQPRNPSDHRHIVATFLIDLTNNTSLPFPNSITLNNSFLLNESNLVALISSQKHPSKKKICQYALNSPATSPPIKIAKLTPSRRNYYDSNIVVYSRYLSGCIVEDNNQLNLYRYTEQTNQWTLDPSKNIDISSSHPVPIKRLYANENGYVVGCHEILNQKVVFSLWDPNLERLKNITIQNDIAYVEHVALLPDNTTLVASFLTDNTSGLCILNFDSQQYNLIRLPSFIASLQVFPSGELLIATVTGHLIPIDIECMKAYRETQANSVTNAILANSTLIKPLADLATSYLCHSRMFAKPQILLHSDDMQVSLDNKNGAPSSPKRK